MSTPAAHYHQVRAAHFRRHSENARSPETREMYVRLAEREAAMAEAASANQGSVVAPAQQTNQNTDRAPGVGGSVRIDKPGREIVHRHAPPHRNDSG